MRKNYMKALLAIILIVSSKSVFAQTTLAGWTFESSTLGSTTPSSTGKTYSYNADLGSGTAMGNHASSATVYSFPAGNGSRQSLSSDHWAAGDYWQFQFATTGYNSIQLSWDQTGSNTGPKDFKIQYSTDGATFTDVPSSITNSSYSITSDSWSATSHTTRSNRAIDFSSITTLNNQSAVYIRVVMNSTTSINNGSVATAGTDRIDNVIITGVGGATTLPVILDSFNVSKTVGGALLKWNTRTEINTSRFDIEKSLDGKTFTTLTGIAAKNIASGANYSYLDNSYQNGIVYYRLKMYDADNTFKTSKIIAVTNATTNSEVSLKYTLVKNKIELNNLSGSADVRIISISGATHIRQSVSNASASIDVSSLPKGMYFVQLSNSEGKNLKFVKQ